MLKTAYVLILNVIFFQSLSVNASELEIKPLNRTRKEVDAGISINVLVTFLNNVNKEKELGIKLLSPGDNWKLIADYLNIPIDSSSSLSKIIGIQIMKNLKAGDYSIELEAFDKSDGKTFGQISIPITVKPRLGIQLDKFDVPSYFFAGDTLTTYFKIKNLSNLDVQVSTSLANGLHQEKKTIPLKKDSSYIYPVKVFLPDKISNYTRESVVLDAFVQDKPETRKSTYQTFEVFPVGNAKVDFYNRYPVKIAGNMVASNRYGKMAYSSMYDLSGGNYIDKGRSYYLDFHIRGPNRTGNALLGLNDEYNMNLKSSWFEVSLGDNGYDLSDLTESSRSGRGLRLEFKHKKFSIGSFYHAPRYFPSIRNVYSVYSLFQPNRENRMLLGFLSKKDTLGMDSRLLTFAGNITPVSWLKTEFELAAGNQLNIWSKAYKLGIFLSRPAISTFFSYTYADPNFPGYVTNTHRLNSGLSINLKKIGFSLNYNQNYSTLALDTLFSNAPFSSSMSMSVYYRFTPAHTLTVGGFISSLTDRSPIPLFNNDRTTGRMSFSSKIAHLGIQLQGEFGTIKNLLDSSREVSDFYSGSLSVNYLLNQTFIMAGFLNYQGGKQFRLIGSERLYYGISIGAKLGSFLNLTLQYNNNYELKDYTQDRSLLSLQLNGKLNASNELNLGVSYNLMKNTLDKKELNIQARFIHTLNVPISKKKDIGSFSGMIVNNGVESVSGIILNLNGLTAITDKKGKFRFPSIQVGTYPLLMIQTSLGLHTTAETPGPYFIKIEPGKETKFELSLTKSARIAGRIVIKDDEKSSQKGYIMTKYEFERIIVEASNGTEVFRLYATSDEPFSFEDLRPGKWHVKVYPNGIPQGYQLLTENFDYTLTPGANQAVEVLVGKKSRQIKFQNTVTPSKPNKK